MVFTNFLLILEAKTPVFTKLPTQEKPASSNPKADIEQFLHWIWLALIYTLNLIPLNILDAQDCTFKGLPTWSHLVGAIWILHLTAHALKSHPGRAPQIEGVTWPNAFSRHSLV